MKIARFCGQFSFWRRISSSLGEHRYPPLTAVSSQKNARISGHFCLVAD
jgi:hypothetical protein